MKLYEVINGYTGNSYVRCLVIAETEERAIELAREEYKNDSKKCRKHIKDDSNYWENLKTVELCDDTSKEYIGGVED